MAELQSLTDTWGTDMVSVLIGSGKKKFVLHKKLLCKEAPFFEKMFNGSFREASTQDCHLKDVEPYAFEVVASYIYTKSFPDDIKGVSGFAGTYAPIVKFYVLADRFLMTNKAKTASLDALISTRATTVAPFPKYAISFVLTNTANDCPLRKLVIDFVARDFLTSPSLDLDWLKCCLECASVEQTMQLMLAIKHVGVIKHTNREDFCKKMVREKRSITNVPEYRVGYLKDEVRNLDEPQK